MRNTCIENPGRRNFLRTAPAAAVAGLALTDLMILAAQAAGQASGLAGASIPAGGFLLFTAQTIADDIKALDAAPGDNKMVGQKEFLVALTVEKAHTAKQFEWHEGRDHVLVILDGTTVYELGGTPKGAHSIVPGEWRAPESEGAATVTLQKGDMLVIPRGTPHMRNTVGSMAMLLISPTGKA
jgi:mannose-6-phosphate isomerase-like protein (cupin superfamily)